MIGAHVPRKPKKRVHRQHVAESARMFDRAFDEWTRRPGRTHLVRVVTPGTPHA